MSLVYEAASGLVTGTLVDQGPGTGIQPATLRVFIYDEDTETTLLADQALTPISTYVDANGKLTYYILPSANSIVNSNKTSEIHTIRFTWTWTAQGATQTGKEELAFAVTNLSPN